MDLLLPLGAVSTIRIAADRALIVAVCVVLAG